MSAIQELIDYVQSHSVRGTCRCGQCVDHSGVDIQPNGHTADLVFFQVASNGGDPEKLKALVNAVEDATFPVNLFDGQEHGYIEIGGWIGDQGLAMMLMGLGSVLGLWRLITPKMLGLPDAMAMQMAGMGMVVIQHSLTEKTNSDHRTRN